MNSRFPTALRPALLLALLLMLSLAGCQHIAPRAPISASTPASDAAGVAPSTATIPDIKSWAFVDGGGLNWDPDWDTYFPQLTVLGHKLYAAWREMTPDDGPMQVHVAVYNGNDQAPAWRFVDGNPSGGLNRNAKSDAFNIQIAAFDARLYAIWQEETSTGAHPIHVAVYNGNDAAPTWSAVAGPVGINHDPAARGAHPQLMVSDSKLYAIWMESNGATLQIRAAVYNGNDVAPGWRFVDGNGIHGLNKNVSENALHPRLTPFSDRLYATWVENHASGAQIRVAVYSGNDMTPTWNFVDGGQETGINRDPARDAAYPALAVYNAKLYAAWTESNGDANQVQVAVYNGEDHAPAWTFVDGNGTGLNRYRENTAYTPQLTAFGSKLYATWYETDGGSDSSSQLRVALYNANDQAPAWSFVDGGGASGLNKDVRYSAFDPQLTVFQSKLYLTWKELSDTGGHKIHVMVGQ